MVRIEFIPDEELKAIMDNSKTDILEKLTGIIANEAIHEIDQNFERGGSDSPWEPNDDGSKPLQGTGKLRMACTENAVIEKSGEEITITPGGFPADIADHLTETKGEFMVIPEFRQEEFNDRVADRLLRTLKEGL